MLESHRHPELSQDAYAPRDDVRAFVTTAVHEASAQGHLDADTDPDTLVEMLLVLMFGMGFYAGFVGTDAEVTAVVDKLQKMLSNNLWRLREPAAT
jgi:hypothetical protein